MGHPLNLQFMRPAMTDEAPGLNLPERKRRVVYLVLGGLWGLPALMLLGGYAFWYRQCKADLDAEVQRVVDRGEPLRTTSRPTTGPSSRCSGIASTGATR